MPPSSVAALGLVAAAAALFAIGLAAGVARTGRPRPIDALPGLLGCTLAALAGGLHLASGGASIHHGLRLAPQLEPAIGLDPLTAFFLLVVGGVGFIQCAVSWLGERPPRARTLHAILLGQLLTITAADGYVLLAGWGLTLIGLAQRREPLGVRATGLPLVAAALVLQGGGALLTLPTFGDSAAAPGSTWFISGLFILGFVALGGMPPLHASRVGATTDDRIAPLINGMLPATAIYGLVRCGSGLPPAAPTGHWLAPILVAAGGTAALYTTLRAIAETDVERVAGLWTAGYASWSLVGLGTLYALAPAGSAPGPYHTTAVAALLALAANLAIGGGALAAATAALTSHTETTDLDAMAGRRLPRRIVWTLLLAGLTLTAVPPLSGFLPGWLALDAAAAGPMARPLPHQASLAVATLVTALLVASQLACLVRLAGVFLSSESGREETAGDAASRVAHVSLAATAAVTLLLACVAGGVLGLPLLERTTAIADVAAEGAIADAIAAPTLSALLAMLAIAGVATLWMRSRQEPRARRAADAQPAPAKSTATGLAQPLTSELATLFRPEEATELLEGYSAYNPEALRFVRTLVPIPRTAARTITSALTGILDRLRLLDLAPARAPGVAYLLAVLVILLLVVSG